MAARQVKPALSTAQLEALLAERYAAPEYATLFNVKNGTGYGRVERYADAIAMNLYPSRGLEVIGFEIKATRGDWLRERDNPAKAEPIARFCDRWVLVVSAEDIVKPGELPSTWGLLAPGRGGLAMKVEPPKLEAQPLDRRFVAALLRRAAEAPPEKVTAAERRGYERGVKQGEDRVAEATERWQRDLTHATEVNTALRQEVQRFEQAAGISITGWAAQHAGGNTRLGEVFAAMLAGRFDVELVTMQHQLQLLLASTDAALSVVQAHRKGAP